jgi:hypothetical protein
MAYTGKPVFQFSDTSQTEIDEISIGSLVYIENSGQLFTKVSGTGLGASSTIQDAINGGNLILVQTENSGATATDQKIYFYGSF